LASRFVQGGYAVVGLARDPSRLEAQPGVTMRTADASNPLALAKSITEGGPVSVLIYNAYRATMARRGPSDIDPAELVEDFRVNVAGALVAVQSVLPAMLNARAGSILLTGGGLALDPTGWLPAASLAIGKSGIRSLALTLHAELAPTGIHAGTVTIAGQVKTGTAFDPKRIAEAFWDLHADRPGSFRGELVYRG
jgi:short-subunit dehydrogenase